MPFSYAARFYREEGERLRIAAANTRHEDVRADLLTLADRYDHLAELSDARPEFSAALPADSHR